MSERVRIVEHLNEYFDAGDVDGMMHHVAPDVVVTQDRLPWGGRYVVRDGVIDFGLKLATTVDTSIATEQLFAAGDCVIQVGRSRGSIRATGATYDVPECHVRTFQEGLVFGVQFFIESDTILDLLGR